MSSISELNIDRTVEVSLTAEPQQAFFAVSGGRSAHLLVNTGTQRLAVKLRCSNNSLYRMSPVMSFIDRGQTQTIVITRLPGPARVDKVVVQYTEATTKDKDVRERFNTAISNKIENARIMLKAGNSRESKSFN